jgi:hypothetical protein
MRYFFMLAVALLMSVDVGATPYWLVTGGTNGISDRSTVGIEAGGTRVIMDKFPLSAELSMNFNFGDIPDDTHFNTNRLNEPYTIRRVNDGPEIGYLFKSGVNLDDLIKNLTLQVGAGYALQTVIPVATGALSGTHWQQGGEYTDVYPVGYGGLLYRLKNICFSAGYNNRRGMVAGIGSSW